MNLDIRAGEVHVVAGENGAGKSTLMKLLAQLERPSRGEIAARDGVRGAQRRPSADELLGRFASNHIHAVPGDRRAELRAACAFLEIDLDELGG